MTNELSSICNYIKSKKEITDFKLQRLLYFIQASSLIYLKREAFKEDFEAWQYGTHIKEFSTQKLKYTPLYDTELKELIDIILYHLGDKTSYELVDIICSYDSWKNAWWGSKSIKTISKTDIIKCHIKIAKSKKGFIF